MLARRVSDDDATPHRARPLASSMPRPSSASPRPPRPGRRASDPRLAHPRARRRVRRVPPPARSTSTRAQTRNASRTRASRLRTGRSGPHLGAGPISPASRRATRSSFLDDKATSAARRAASRLLALARRPRPRPPRDIKRGPLLAAIRGWRLAAEATRARREVETLDGRRRRDPRLRRTRRLPAGRSFASLRSVRSPPLRIRPCACDPTHPMYGKMDDALARWLGMDEPPPTRSRRRAPIRALRRRVGRATARRRRVRAEARRDGDAVGCGARGGSRAEALAEPRAGDGSIRRRRALGETGGKTRLNARVGRLAALEEARATSVDARAFDARRDSGATSGTRESGSGIEREREHGGERGGGDGRDSPPRRSSSRSRRGAGSVRSEVEELEECAAACEGRCVAARGRAGLCARTRRLLVEMEQPGVRIHR